MPSHPTFLLTLLLFPPLTLNTILSLRDGFSPDNEILRNDNWCITGQSDVGNGFSARLGGMAGLFIAIVKIMVFMFADVNEDGRKFYELHSPTILFMIFANLSNLLFQVYVLTVAPASAHFAIKILICSLAYETLLIGGSFWFNYLSQIKIRRIFKYDPRPPLPPHSQSKPSVSKAMLGKKTNKKKDDDALTEAPEPEPAVDITNNIPSRIIFRTTAICSTAFAVPFFRDLFYPGHVLKWFPNDVRYLIFTKSYLHSPPLPVDNSHLMYLGSKILSQRCGLQILLICLFKISTSILIKNGPPLERSWREGWDSHSSIPKLHPSSLLGPLKQVQVLKLQTLGNVLIWMTMWRFYHAALELEGYKTNHALIVIFWETFILGIYAWF
ncbi:hypothetical protein TrVE_jg10717 [Triparma verrucosa]|uniref:Uncharacterized protein n=1 Tax=Triparma verrucosa TaxID=1606542 RepID=A0A9W7C7G0_9STRA|nr:hypothetical protein TrVE_jg10717 [Triparma verrucosa]